MYSSLDGARMARQSTVEAAVGAVALSGAALMLARSGALMAQGGEGLGGARVNYGADGLPISPAGYWRPGMMPGILPIEGGGV